MPIDPLQDYVASLFAREDDLLLSLREDADRSGLPPISVNAECGRLLQVLITMVGAKRVLEVGTLGGYSAIWMGRALPTDARLLSLELNPSHAAFARRYIHRAGLSSIIEVREGRALELLPALDGEPFDLVFLDADKAPLPLYLEWSLRLVRPGGLIVADNALWSGKVIDRSIDDEATRGVREFNSRFASDPRITGIIVPSHDGVAIGVVGRASPTA